MDSGMLDRHYRKHKILFVTFFCAAVLSAAVAQEMPTVLAMRSSLSVDNPTDSGLTTMRNMVSGRIGLLASRSASPWALNHAT